MSETDKLLKLVARDSGWVIQPGAGSGTTWVRPAPLPDGHLKRIADGQGWEPRESITVLYNAAGHVLDGFLATPREQAALTGKHHGAYASVAGEGRRNQIIRWMVTDRDYSDLGDDKKGK